MDTRTRSWIKSITWRIIGVVILGAISYACTRDVKAMTIITILFHGIRLILYYWHERFWENVSWGRMKHPLSNLPVKPGLAREEIRQIEQILDQHGFLARHPEYEI